MSKDNVTCTLILNVGHGSDRSTMANCEYVCCLMHLSHVTESGLIQPG